VTVLWTLVAIEGFIFLGLRLDEFYERSCEQIEATKTSCGAGGYVRDYLCNWLQSDFCGENSGSTTSQYRGCSAANADSGFAFNATGG
jgi:hypothetical protein